MANAIIVAIRGCRRRLSTLTILVKGSFTKWNLCREPEIDSSCRKGGPPTAVARFWLFIALLSPLFAQEQPFTEGFRLLYQEHDYEKATSVFQKIVRQTPGNAEAWRCLGRSTAALGRREEAITAFKRAIDLT